NSSVGKDDPVFSFGHDSSGPGGTGMQFDGVDDYVVVPDHNSLDISTQLSVETWVKIEKKPTGNDQNIVHKNTEYLLRYTNGGAEDVFSFYLYNGTDWMPVMNSSTHPVLNTWYHVVATWDDSTNDTKIYVNGVLENTVQNTNTINFSTSDLYISSWSATDSYLSGSIDEVRIYNRTLSADEIRKHYNQKKPILHLKMDEGSGTTAYDES
ncbi:MAG: LamG domain-containing protein, partial [Patescibacteria group bacterium]|nr:LamG domain-containing protein [Patescibacteria group bacterium]